ncbi:MAG: hypothetical protein L0G94_11860 [Brachybacterium sp.]|uniref:hypothetical protein n=1 Tax=Brachybacterium sp. TaxID=1891286 RepID=UPI002647FCF1|nr:hypothetical protein [Brachybacterium sp.]MDN5687352.1 hypothetical protein [Brachybacterium sp.]
MTTIMRRTVRGAATGLGALAVVAGASSCGSLLGGGDEDGSQDPAGEEQSAEEGGDGAAAEEGDGAGDEGDDAASDEGDDTAAEDDGDDVATDEGGDDAAAGGEVAEEELGAAKQRVLTFFEALGEQDAEAACSVMLDPSTGEPASGEGLADCVDELESSGQLEQFTPEVVDVITEDMLEAEGNDDGTITISAAGTEVSMQKADDGTWYIAG